MVVDDLTLEDRKRIVAVRLRINEGWTAADAALLMETITPANITAWENLNDFDLRVLLNLHNKERYITWLLQQEQLSVSEPCSPPSTSPSGQPAS